MRQYNDMIDRISTLYVENKTEILWLIQWGTVYEEDQIGQQCEWSYKCGLCWNQNWTIMTDQTRCRQSQKLDKIMICPIVKVWSSQNIILNYQDWLDSVRSMTKMRQETDVTDRIVLLYFENEIELWWPIR